MKTRQKHHPAFNTRPAHTGFTLVELLVTMTIAAIMAVAATPAMQGLLASARLREKTERLSAQIQLARAEAVRGNRTVYICALKAKSNLQVQGCNTVAAAPDSYDWGQGTLIYADDLLAAGKTFARYDTGEHLSHVVFDQTTEIRAGAAQIAFAPTGRARNGQALAFALRDKNTGNCRTVLMDMAGRPRACRSGENYCDAC